MGEFINQELTLFLESAFYGMLIGLSYDGLRIFRRIFRHKNVVVYIEDYLFWVIWGVILFALTFNYNDGNVRGYIFAAAAAGCVLYLKSFSPILVKYVSSILGKIITLLLKKPFKKLKMIFIKVFKRLWKGMRGIHGKVRSKKKEEE